MAVLKNDTGVMFPTQNFGITSNFSLRFSFFYGLDVWESVEKESICSVYGSMLSNRHKRNLYEDEYLSTRVNSKKYDKYH